MLMINGVVLINVKQLYILIIYEGKSKYSGLLSYLVYPFFKVEIFKILSTYILFTCNF